MYNTCSCVGNYFSTKEKVLLFDSPSYIYIYIYILVVIEQTAQSHFTITLFLYIFNLMGPSTNFIDPILLISFNQFINFYLYVFSFLKKHSVWAT